MPCSNIRATYFMLRLLVDRDSRLNCIDDVFPRMNRVLHVELNERSLELVRITFVRAIANTEPKMIFFDM